MNRRTRPAHQPARLVPALLAVAIAALLFVTLMVRLDITEEGYRLSALRSSIAKLNNRNRELSVKVAELSSQARLRALAPRYHLAPPAPGQVVILR